MIRALRQTSSVLTFRKTGDYTNVQEGLQTKRQLHRWYVSKPQRKLWTSKIWEYFPGRRYSVCMVICHDQREMTLSTMPQKEDNQQL